MGFTPAQIDAMSLWEFGMVVEGFNDANGGEEEPEGMSDDEFDDMKKRLLN